MSELLHVRYVRGTYRSGPLRVILGYVMNAEGTDLEPAMILVTERRRALANNAYAIALSAAAEYATAKGGPTSTFLTEKLPLMCGVLDLNTGIEAHRVVDAVLGFMPELVRMPPVSDQTLREHNQRLAGAQVGEASLILDGKVIAEQPVHDGVTESVH